MFYNAEWHFEKKLFRDSSLFAYGPRLNHVSEFFVFVINADRKHICKVNTIKKETVCWKEQQKLELGEIGTGLLEYEHMLASVDGRYTLALIYFLCLLGRHQVYLQSSHRSHQERVRWSMHVPAHLWRHRIGGRNFQQQWNGCSHRPIQQM